MNVPTSLPLSPVVGSVLPTPVIDTGAESEQSQAPIPPVAARRGVLDSAFAVLDALALADEDLGLTALARANGVAETSVHRLDEQLVTLPIRMARAGICRKERTGDAAVMAP
jgi:nitroreductase